MKPQSLITFLCSAVLAGAAVAQATEPAASANDDAFARAARDYARVAHRETQSVPSLTGRVKIVQDRITSLETQLQTSNDALTSLDRQEMETLLLLKAKFRDDELGNRKSETERSFKRRRSMLQQNKELLQKDLDDARQDLQTLGLDLELARADEARQPKNLDQRVDPATQVATRVAQYCAEKVRMLGLPTLQPVPSDWIRNGLQRRDD